MIAVQKVKKHLYQSKVNVSSRGFRIPSKNCAKFPARAGNLPSNMAALLLTLWRGRDSSVVSKPVADYSYGKSIK